MIESLRRFSGSEIATQKLKIINFYDSHGEIPTKEAFGVDRKVISRWKKRLTLSDGKLSSLVPFSTKPISVRVPTTRPEIVDFIKSQREAHFRIGKEKLKIFLDRYCEENFIPKIKATLSQTDLIEKNESVKKLMEKGKEFMDEFEKFKNSNV